MGRGYNTQILGPKRWEMGFNPHMSDPKKAGMGFNPHILNPKRWEGGYNAQILGPKRWKGVTTLRFWVLKRGGTMHRYWILKRGGYNAQILGSKSKMGEGIPESKVWMNLFIFMFWLKMLSLSFFRSLSRKYFSFEEGTA